MYYIKLFKSKNISTTLIQLSAQMKGFNHFKTHSSSQLSTNIWYLLDETYLACHLVLNTEERVKIHSVSRNP